MSESTMPTVPTPTAPVETPADSGEALLGRLRFLAAMAVAALIFWYVGWRVMRPLDPRGPISLLMVEQGVIAMAQLLGLAIIAAGLAVAICGSGSAERGPLAVAVGLGTMGLRGSQLDALVMYRLNPPLGAQAAVDPYPATALIAECWLWLALIAVGFVVGRWVESWFKSAPPADPDTPVPADHSPDLRQGFGAALVASLVAWGFLSFAMGDEGSPMLKGQVYFAVCAAFLLGALAAHWLCKGSSRVWLLIVVALVATVAYLVGGPDRQTLELARQTGLYVNLRPITRPLPLEYAALGAIGILWERDWMRMLRSLVGLSPESKEAS